VERGNRIRIKFKKGNALKYISHLDLLRTMERAIRRSKLPIAYSEGFHPHAQVQFASALPVGVASLCELMELELTEELAASDVKGRLSEQLPVALAPSRAAVVPQSEGRLMSLVQGAGYWVRVGAAEDLASRVQGWLDQETILWQRKQKNKVRQLNLRAATLEIKVKGQDQLELFLFFSPEATNVRPQEVVASLELVPRELVRTAILGQGVLLGSLEKGKH
jgi:radical SAM-linked protein